MKKLRLSTIFTGKTVFIVTISAYIGMFFLNREGFLKTIHYATDLFIKLLPIFALVFIFMFISNLFLSANKIIKHLGEDSGKKGYFLAIIGGILSSGPIYMWFPLLADLKEKGMKDALAVTFLYNRAIKLPLIPVMVYYFDLEVVVIITVYMILFSIINGVIVNKITLKNLTKKI